MKYLLMGFIGLSALAACIETIHAPNYPQTQASPAEPEAPAVIEAAAPVAPPAKPAPSHMGWVERIKVVSVDMTAKAKLDSGAATSAINAEIIKIFKRDKQEYVLFRVVVEDEELQPLERKIVRWVRIKKKEGGHIRRPVVIMSMCLGDQKVTGEVNLSSRDNFIYPILIGRNMLEDRIVIDAGRTFTKKPSCEAS